MEKYKITQNSKTIDIVNALGKEVKVFDLAGMYARGKYEVNNNLALFVDNKTQTLYRVPMSMVAPRYCSCLENATVEEVA